MINKLARARQRKPTQKLCFEPSEERELAVFTQPRDTAINAWRPFPSSKPPGRKRGLNNLGIRTQRWEFVIWMQRNRNGNLRDPFSPSGDQTVPVLSGPSVLCTLQHHSSLTRNGSSTKNPHFLLLKDAFLERCDAASVSTNKNPTEKCCLFFQPPLRTLHCPPPPSPMILLSFLLLFPLLSRVLLCCWTCQRPSRCLSSTWPSIFLLKLPPPPRSTFPSLMAPLLRCK